MSTVSESERGRRGRTARQRGNQFERDIAHRIGGGARRVGQFGDKVDVDAGWLRAQCKVGLSYPERLDAWLRAIPYRHDSLRAVIVGDSPKAGTRRRIMIVLDLDEYLAWYGTPTDDTP